MFSGFFRLFHGPPHGGRVGGGRRGLAGGEGRVCGRGRGWCVAGAGGHRTSAVREVPAPQGGCAGGATAWWPCGRRARGGRGGRVAWSPCGRALFLQKKKNGDSPSCKYGAEIRQYGKKFYTSLPSMRQYNSLVVKIVFLHDSSKGS